jgi:hypothetical protein
MNKTTFSTKPGWSWAGSLFLAFVLGWLSPVAHSATSSPQVIDVGIYLNNIPSISLKEKKFQVDFVIWFRWTGDEINPVETFSIFNGHIDAKDGVITKKIGDTRYASAHVEATIFRNFDVAHYPLDNQALKIQIEDSKADGRVVTYKPDKDNTNISSKITVPGWAVGQFDSYGSVTSYKTNYGDVSLAKNTETRIPRYTFAIDLKRSGHGYFLKYFSMLFLAAALTLAGFAVSSDLIDTRFFLSTSAIFMAAITGGSLSTSLPETDEFGMGDQLYHMTMGFIFAVTMIFIYLHKAALSEPARAARLSARWGAGLAFGYVAATLLIVTIR